MARRKRMRRRYLYRMWSGNSSLINTGSSRTDFAGMKYNEGKATRDGEPIHSWGIKPTVGPLELFKEFLPVPACSPTTQPKLQDYKSIRLSPTDDPKQVVLYFCGQWAFLIETIAMNFTRRLSICYSVERAKLAYLNNRVQWIKRIRYTPPPPSTD